MSSALACKMLEFNLMLHLGHREREREERYNGERQVEVYERGLKRESKGERERERERERKRERDKNRYAWETWSSWSSGIRYCTRDQGLWGSIPAALVMCKSLGKA